MTFLLDDRAGSAGLAKLEPVRSTLSPCPGCGGTGLHPDATPRNPAPCRGTGRRLSRLTTTTGAGGPDVLICGNGPTGPLLVAVEVKSIRDLLQSADDGRLQAEGEGQLPAMLADYDQSWLLWYGQVRCGDSGHLEEPGGKGDNGRCLWRPFTRNGNRDGRPLPCEYLDGLLLAVAAMGVHVHHVGNERQAARWLGSLYRYWSKPYAEHQFTHTFSAAPRFPQVIPNVTPAQRERARRIFDRYPGLGMERALAAARHFNSVREMANADEREWAKVPGIGKVIAAAVVKGFNS
jgi:ERCC4-type nuclease